jgi:hypothetical protein
MCESKRFHPWHMDLLDAVVTRQQFELSQAKGMALT